MIQRVTMMTLHTMGELVFSYFISVYSIFSYNILLKPVAILCIYPFLPHGDVEYFQSLLLC